VKPLPMLSSGQKIEEIRRLYYQTSRPTIQQDLAKAIDLVKSMTGEEERERAAVYMDGLAQMRSDWARERNWKPKSLKAKTKNSRTKKNY
jgi:hypothetical protein